MILSGWQIFDILDELKTQFSVGFFLHVCISYNSNLRNDVETTMYFLFVKTIGKEIDIQVSMCFDFCWEVTCIVVNYTDFVCTHGLFGQQCI